MPKSSGLKPWFIIFYDSVSGWAVTQLVIGSLMWLHSAGRSAGLGDPRWLAPVAGSWYWVLPVSWAASVLHVASYPPGEETGFFTWQSQGNTTGKWKADAARSFEAFLTPFRSFRTHLLSLLAYSICQQVARQTQIPGGRDIDFTSGWQQWQCPIAKEFMAIKWFITVATVLGAFNSFKPRNHLVP